MEGIRYNKFSSGLYLTCPDNDMEMSPSWSRAHDWKSCNRQKRFESSNLSISAKGKPRRNAGFSFAIWEYAVITLFYLVFTLCREDRGSILVLLPHLHASSLKSEYYRDNNSFLYGSSGYRHKYI